MMISVTKQYTLEQALIFATHGGASETERDELFTAIITAFAELEGEIFSLKKTVQTLTEENKKVRAKLALWGGYED